MLEFSTVIFAFSISSAVKDSLFAFAVGFSLHLSRYCCLGAST